jgi:hypothetical protein
MDVDLYHPDYIRAYFQKSLRDRNGVLKGQMKIARDNVPGIRAVLFNGAS